VPEPLLQAFPFPSTLGEVTLHPRSQDCVFIYSSHGNWVFPPSCGVFLPPLLLQAFPLMITGRAAAPASRHVCLQLTWEMGLPPSPVGFSYLTCGVFLPPPLSQAFPLLVAGRAPPLPPSPAWLVYLQFQEGFPSPLFSAQCAPPTLLHVFIVLIAYYSVSLFSPGGGWSVQGAMLI
jgi:hypothetical protein